MWGQNFGNVLKNSVSSALETAQSAASETAKKLNEANQAADEERKLKAEAKKKDKNDKGKGKASSKEPNKPATKAKSSAQAPDTSAAKPPGPANDKAFVRLPVASAKKLRFYDKADLNELVKSHLKEKQQVLEENTALRMLVQDQCNLGDEEIDDALGDSITSMRRTNDDVNRVLLLSAQAELETLQAQAKKQDKELASLKTQVSALEAAGARASPARAAPSGATAAPADLDTAESPGAVLVAAAVQKLVAEEEGGAGPLEAGGGGGAEAAALQARVAALEAALQAAEAESRSPAAADEEQLAVRRQLAAAEEKVMIAEAARRKALQQVDGLHVRAASAEAEASQLRGELDARLKANEVESEALTQLSEGSQKELDVIRAATAKANERASVAEARVTALGAALKAAEATAKDRATLGSEVAMEAAKLEVMRQEEIDKRKVAEAKLQRVQKKEGEMRAILEEKVARLSATNEQQAAELEEHMDRILELSKKVATADQGAVEARSKLESSIRLWEEERERQQRDAGKLQKRAEEAEAALAAAQDALAAARTQITQLEHATQEITIIEERHESMVKALNDEMETMTATHTTERTELSGKYEEQLREAEAVRNSLEEKLLGAERKAEGLGALEVQVQQLLAEVEDARDASKGAEGAAATIRQLERARDQALHEVMQTAAIAQELEERVRKAEADVNTAQCDVAEVKAETAAAIEKKELEVEIRLAELEASMDAWPASLREKFESTEAAVESLKGELAAAQAAQSEAELEHQETIKHLEAQLKQKETERLKVVADQARQMSSVEGSLEVATQARDELRSERDSLLEKAGKLEKELSKFSAAMVPMEGVDVLYLKNVIVKFIESGPGSAALGLLPVIATLLQFTPDEFQRIQTAATPVISYGISWT